MKLKQQMLEAIRTQGKARGTFDTYWPWCRNYLIFTMKDGEFVHPNETGEPEVKAWLTYLANRRHVAAGTQNTAMQSVLFMYRHVLGRPLVGIDAFRAKKYETVPTVLSIGEVQRLFNELSGIPLVVAQIMYASGLRIGEVLNLRIKDLDPDRSQIIIRCAKGKKDRVTCYPESLQQLLERRIRSARVRWECDIDEGYKGVPLPDAFWRKSPKAATEWAWFWLLPSPVLSKSPETGEMLRGKLDSSNIGRAIKNAAKRAGITKRVTSHGLRHAFASHLHEAGVGLRVIQRLLGHSHVETTEIYVHVSKDAASSTRSPLENILSNPNIKPRKTEKPKAAEPFKLRIVG